MRDAKIFLINPGQPDPIAIVETPYERESVLQEFLVRCPDLIPGDQIDPDDPRRWLLVAREMAVPGDDDGASRFSLDHLFLDQDGTPTFVECKRSSDTRSRREVIAQMLDYAANGLEYWSIDNLRQSATETAERQGKSLDQEIRLLTGADDEGEFDVEVFWQKAEANLRDSKVRLIFVADETSKELRRLVEFLNDKMVDVQVLAVEIKQFTGAGQTALVPRVVGLTEAARSRQRGPVAESRIKTNRSEFLANCSPVEREFFEGLFDLAEAKGHKVNWGTVGFSLRAWLPQKEREFSFALGYPAGGRHAAARFVVVFTYLPLSEAEVGAMRQSLHTGGLNWEETPEKMRATVSEETVDHLKAAFKIVLDKVDEIIQSDES